jgi:hypothetical protein
MVKKMVVIFLCFTLGSVSYANNISQSQKLIGVEVSISEVQGEAPSIIKNNTSSGIAFGFHIGAQNDEWRTMFLLNVFDNEYRTVDKFLFSLDYFFLKVEALSRYVLQPYAGFNVGFSNYKSVDIDESAFMYGGQGGVLFEFNDNMSFDLGYRYSLSNNEALDHTSDVVFGINYLY